MLTGSDHTTQIQALITALPDGSRLSLEDGDFNISAQIQISGKTDFTFECARAASLNVISGSDVAAIPAALLITNSTRVAVLVNLNGNGMVGANGIGLGGSGTTDVIDCHILPGTKIRGFKRSATLGGGRAITAQFRCFGCSAIGFNVDNCTSGFDVHGWFARPTMGIHFADFHIEDCEEAMSFYDLQDVDTDPYNPTAMQVVVDGGTVVRCGLSVAGLSDDGDASGLNGGVIVSERARSVSVRNISVVNPSSYGTIGALLRGTGQMLTLSNIEFHASATALIWAGYAKNILPVDPGHTTGANVRLRRLNASNIRAHGALTHVVKVDTTDFMSASRLTEIGVYSCSGDLISNGNRTDCYAEIYNIDTQGSVSGTFASIISGGNSLPA